MVARHDQGWNQGMIWTGAKARSVLLLRHVHCSGLVPGHDEDKSGKSMIKTGAKALLGYSAYCLGRHAHW